MKDHAESQDQARFNAAFGGLYPEPPPMPEMRDNNLSTVAVPGTDLNWQKNGPPPPKGEQK